MISIIDYGVNNLKSVKNALDYLGYPSKITNSQNVINQSEYIILPGIGSYRLAMENIKKLKLDEILTDQVLNHDKPILGICLGMQLLSDIGKEDGLTSGLGFIKGSVTKIQTSNLRLPHIGFNKVEWRNFKISKKFQDYYFVHSYEFIPEDKNEIIGCVTYEKNIVAAIKKNRIIGLQFHPEKSQSMGLTLLKSLIENKNFE